MAASDYGAIFLFVCFETQIFNCAVINLKCDKERGTQPLAAPKPPATSALENPCLNTKHAELNPRNEVSA